MKTVSTKYDDLQKRYSSLSDAYESLASDKGEDVEVKNEEDRSHSYPDWNYDARYSNDVSWKHDGFEVDQFVSLNGWQQPDDRAQFL